ncbi:MAG: DUF1622 domain-containing protein [Gulosibacter sp.]|uniref:DUF1622 domain-containing protein n=1 Tax=Gulosibacter sp. TaxID=2817531 RepID=UPI003F937370
MSTDVLHELVHVVVAVFEALGVAAMALGIILAAVYSIRALGKGQSGAAAFQILRRMIGSAILLGLEILVAADLIRTITTPSIEEALILGLIVVIRTVLSVSIQIEIEGVLPWKRALLTSGGQVMAEEINRQQSSERA